MNPKENTAFPDFVKKRFKIAVITTIIITGRSPLKINFNEISENKI